MPDPDIIPTAGTFHIMATMVAITAADIAAAGIGTTVAG
jgi:hypothetical protein